MEQDLLKPRFTVRQLMSATTAAKNFGTLKRRASVEPQFILEHNKVSLVVLSYEAYESLLQQSPTSKTPSS